MVGDSAWIQPGFSFEGEQVYLAGKARGPEQAFHNIININWQFQSVKDRHALPMTRDYMHEESQQLRA